MFYISLKNFLNLTYDTLLKFRNHIVKKIKKRSRIIFITNQSSRNKQKMTIKKSTTEIHELIHNIKLESSIKKGKKLQFLIRYKDDFYKKIQENNITIKLISRN